MNEEKQIDRLLGILSFLRESPDGCAWSKEQTHKSLIPSLVEESYETAETIDEGKTDAELCDELGDILLQIVFHAQIAKERGAFTFEDVAKAISDKLNRRYPTILGDEPNTLKTPEEIDRRWEEIKAEERKAKGISEKDASVLDGVSTALPALVRSAKLKGRASKAGWEWPDVGMMFDKIAEEAEELREEVEAKNIDKERIAAELGDLMFMLVDLARWHDIDAEDALRTTNNRFEERFRHMESSLKKKGLDFKTCAREDRRALWEEAKMLEKNLPKKSAANN
ncbi:MAG: nucleoside triphosphate pyrophosphohydrolase [Alphaproteobacteria bacterium]|nr:nucleoside triphosphate pyrophosphohydrolase [Alphaproteobacteria bacterium]